MIMLSIKRYTAVIVAVATQLYIIQAQAVTDGPMNSRAVEFTEQIAKLVTETMSDDYIGSINLSIGSSAMNLDGKILEIDSDGSVPIVENGTTMLPIRGVAEAIGCDVDYEPETQVVSVCSDETEVNIRIGSDEITVNGNTSEMPVAAKIKNDRTMLPLRATAEALGCDVYWEQETQAITLTRPYQTKRVIVCSTDADTSNAKDVIVGKDITVMQFDTEEAARESVILNESRGLIAEPDYVYKETSLSWGTDKINASTYYNAYSSNQSDFVIAVVDTGLDVSNACFNNKVVKGYSVISNSLDTSDTRGHGTHVASTIADVTKGFDKIKIMPVKVFADSGTTTSLLVNEGIKKAVSSGAKVINLSLGGIGESYSQKQVIEYAINNNVTVVAAAGNENINLCNTFCSPACISGVVTVAAIDSNNQKTDYSNYGSGIIDISAPGENINGASIGGGTTVKSGTSMATPHISGAIGLIRSANKTMSSVEAIAALKSGAVDLGNRSYYGSGIPNLSNLIKKSSATPAPTATAEVAVAPLPTERTTERPVSTTVPTEFPSNTYTARVSGTDGELVINSKPSVGHDIGLIPEGEQCTVYPDKRSGNWSWVEYHGISGYSYSSYLIPTSGNSLNTCIGIVKGTDGTLVINSKPSVGHDIGLIPEGASCTVYPDKQSGNWYWVSYGGISGYSYKDYIILQ